MLDSMISGLFFATLHAIVRGEPARNDQVSSFCTEHDDLRTTDQLKNSSNYNVEYRDGIKSEGDKIGMPCTHSTVI